jgi:lactate dehydrogenase-like 2-hydroxyacid dehydrogenase
MITVVDAPSGGYLDRPDIEQEILATNAEVELLLVTESTRDELLRLKSPYLILWHRVALDAAFFERNTACRAVVCASVGYDHVDVDAARRHGVGIYHVPQYGTEEVADHTLAVFLAVSRKLIELDRHVRGGGWDWRLAHGIRRLRGQTWGVVGLGRIGLAVAERARAFGMRLAFHDPYNHPGIEKSLDLTRAHTLDDLLAISDVLSLHVPLDRQTHHLIGAAQLRAMRPGSCLINTARGAIIDLSALGGALAEERPGSVALDVVEGEPALPQWLRHHPRVLLTPHAAFYSVESLIELRTRAAEAVRQLLAGTPVTTAIRVI